jgi:hypothetical protein
LLAGLEFFDVADVALGVDRVRADEALIRLAVDEPVRVRPVMDVNALALQRVINAIQPETVPASFHVRVVGDGPKRIGPRHERADPALGPGGNPVGLQSDGRLLRESLACGRTGGGKRGCEQRSACEWHRDTLARTQHDRTGERLRRSGVLGSRRTNVLLAESQSK